MSHPITKIGKNYVVEKLNEALLNAGTQKNV